MQGQDFVSFISDQIGGNLSPLTIFRDQQGYTGKVIAASSSLEEVRRLVRAGYGIGSLPEHVAARDVAQGELWRLRQLPALPIWIFICCGIANRS